MVFKGIKSHLLYLIKNKCTYVTCKQWNLKVGDRLDWDLVFHIWVPLALREMIKEFEKGDIMVSIKKVE